MLPTVYSYRASLLLTFLLIALSLYPFAESPKIETRFADKYTHFLMYGGYGIVLWIESAFTRQHSGILAQCLICVVWPILFGGINEVLQSTLTTTRQGDFYDFLANALGVLFVFPLGWRFLRRRSR